MPNLPMSVHSHHEPTGGLFGYYVRSHYVVIILFFVPYTWIYKCF